MGGKEVSESGERANDTLLLIIQRSKREDESPEVQDVDEGMGEGENQGFNF